MKKLIKNTEYFCSFIICYYEFQIFLLIIHKINPLFLINNKNSNRFRKKLVQIRYQLSKTYKVFRVNKIFIPFEIFLSLKIFHSNSLNILFKKKVEVVFIQKDYL
jgi:hypothetical protein